MERYKREQRELSFMVYVTDSLRLRAEGKYVSERWYDMAFPHQAEDVDAEAVINHVINGAGLEVIKT